MFGHVLFLVERSFPGIKSGILYKAILSDFFLLGLAMSGCRCDQPLSALSTCGGTLILGYSDSHLSFLVGLFRCSDFSALASPDKLKTGGKKRADGSFVIDVPRSISGLLQTRREEPEPRGERGAVTKSGANGSLAMKAKQLGFVLTSEMISQSGGQMRQSKKDL